MAPRPVVLTAAWLALLAVFFRWWDLTTRVPRLAAWSCVFLAAFALTLRLARRPEGSSLRPELWRLAGWAALISGAALGSWLVPQVQIRDSMVRTTVFVQVFDTVIPLWIVVRAVIVVWTGWARAAALATLPLALAAGLWFMVMAMPGRSHRGPPAPLTAAESLHAAAIERDVHRLAGDIGERHYRFPQRLDAAAGFIESTLTAAGYPVASLPFTADTQRFRNLEVTIRGATDAGRIVVIGAHYDVAEGAPGADDNASGTAVMLALARAVQGRRFARTVRFVAFANEEPPFFAGPDMGSRHYAALAARRGDAITAMLSLETVGYFSDEAGSQRYPPPLNRFYPDRGNFVGFVGNLGSRALVRRAIRTFRGAAVLPSEGVAAPALIPGISWSDHWSFWHHGWRAIMITDTAPFRNPHYHMRTDTPDRLDYARMAQLVTGLIAVLDDLAGG